MRELDTEKIYDLSDLTSEEKNDLLMYLTKVNESWAGDIEKIQFFECDYLYFCFDWMEKGEWLVSRDLELIKNKQVTNAKELFYTLENIQVDCFELTAKQIKEIADVFKKDGYEIGTLDLFEKYRFIRKNIGKYCLVEKKDENKTTITYDKFMELFGKEEVKLNLESNPFSGNLLCKELKKYWNKEKSQEFNNLVEVLNEELTEEAYKETEYEVTMIAEQPKDQIPDVGKMIDKPIQYQIGIDAIGIAEKNMTIDECLAIARFNITKYSYRKKNQDLEDFKKVIAYANWAISLLNKGSN